jgi:hypothetical protein
MVSYRIVDMFEIIMTFENDFLFCICLSISIFLGIFYIIGTVNDARVLFRQHGINNKLISRVTHADGENKKRFKIIRPME